MRVLSSFVHPGPIRDDNTGDVHVWKVLLAVTVLVATGAVVVLALGPDSGAREASPTRVRIGAAADVEPQSIIQPREPRTGPRPATGAEGTPGSSAGPAPDRPARGDQPRASGGDCDDDDDDDGVDVISPCPDDVADDADDDRDDDDGDDD